MKQFVAISLVLMLIVGLIAAVVRPRLAEKTERYAEENEELRGKISMLERQVSNFRKQLEVSDHPQLEKYYADQVNRWEALADAYEMVETKSGKDTTSKPESE